MFYPIDRARCRNVLTENLERLRNNLEMLEKAVKGLETYKRTTTGKYLRDHLKETQGIYLHDCSSDYSRSFSISALDPRAEERIYPKKPAEGQTEKDVLGLAVLSRIEGIREGMADLSALLDGFDALMDEYEPAARTIERVNDAKGMFYLRDLVPALRTS